MVFEEWNIESNKWKAAAQAVVTVEPLLALEEVDLDSNIAEVASDDSSQAQHPAQEELGLFELLVAGNEEIELAGGPVKQLGQNIEELTQSTQNTFAGPFSGPQEVIAAIDRYSDRHRCFLAEIERRVVHRKVSSGQGCRNARELFRAKQGTWLIDQRANNNCSANSRSVEPSIKEFRSSVMAAKQAVLRLPPMTRRFKRSRASLVDHFDEITVDLTSFLERVGLLRARLSGTLEAKSVSQLENLN